MSHCVSLEYMVSDSLLPLLASLQTRLLCSYEASLLPLMGLVC